MSRQESSRFSRLSPLHPDRLLLIGLAWFVMKGVFDVVVNSNMRFMSDSFGYHPFQLVFFYSAMAAVTYLPTVLRRPRAYLPQRSRLYVLRGLLEVAAFSLLFYAVTMMPFATFTSLTFITPVIASVMAVLLLGEQMTMRKWIGLALGFIGILIIARPDAATFNWGVVMILGAATGFSCCGVIIRTLAQDEPPSRIAFGTLCMMALFSLPLAVTHWQMPVIAHLPFLAILGLGSATCQFCVGKALQKLNLTTVQPLSFLALIWSSIVGYIWFGESVAWSAVIGAVCIISGVIYSVRKPRRCDRVLPGSQPAP